MILIIFLNVFVISASLDSCLSFPPTRQPGFSPSRQKLIPSDNQHGLFLSGLRNLALL